MGKKVKAKPKKAQQREPLADAGSGDEASQDVEEAAASAGDWEQCGHYSRDGRHLDKVLREIVSAKHLASCEHCREEAPRKKGGGGGKEKGGKQQKKKGAAAKTQAKAEKNDDLWVCLDCGRHFCGGAVSDTKPYGHARRHAKQDRHWWAARYDKPTVAYCLSCEHEVSIELPVVETVVAAPAVEKVVLGAVDSNALVLANSHGNVIKGLPNLGNTCFFNAVLQSLLALDKFRSKMLGPDVPTGAIAMSLKKLFVETSASNDAGGALSPKSLFSSICSKYPQFKGYQMQDSHELLRCFLDGLGTEETEARNAAEDASSAAGVPTIVDSIFGGQLSSTVSSTECTHGSVKHDQFLDLSLPVPSRKPPARSVSSPPAKRTKQSIRDRNKNRRYGKVATRVSPAIAESSKEQVQTVAEGNDSQIPGSELGQVVSEKEHEPSECSESCASVPNQELKAASNVEADISWLDYLADADETKSEILDSACSTGAGQIWNSNDAAIHGSFHSGDDALPKEQALISEHSGENIVDDATCLQTVILLPYKEFDTTAEEIYETAESSQNPIVFGPHPADYLAAENHAQPLYGGDGEQDDCFGIGDMFGEPEVTSDAKKETGTTGDIDVMAWSSNSADDEVDDSNAPVSVEGCLSLYTEPELLSESWHCENCSIPVAQPNTNELKEGEETAASANDRKDSAEMMASGDEKQDDKVPSCSKKEDIDQIMATDGCSVNVNPDMCCNEGVCANPPSVDAENTSDGNSPDIDTTEQPDSKTYHQECRNLNSSAVEFTSSSKQPHDFAQHNDGYNVDVAAEETSAPVSCGDNDPASCSTTSDKKVESGGANAEEVVTSSLPPETQSILPSAKDNEDGFTRTIGRRKRMKMVVKVHKGQDNQNKQKEDETKVFRAAMRRILISKAPPVLTITLNRFSHDSHGRFRKLKGHVRFKETLDIRPYMDPRSKDNDITTYRLVAVVEHMGSMTGGHYVAYVRSGKIGGRQQQSRSSKSWFYASDSHVRETSLEEVLNCEAYILFYERVAE
ncbi:ubiquitin carboxyl-terminal hydrolase 2 isoform X2 [Aegilops tauschii subsp. strangulata]|uniref:Uncharacterized protein n=3 Tax=Aegilops tauschii TaxID=37682 RepID=A0A453L7Q4_AEGTS|nr:ubiquitin carboxyl-terminal hydrolase 16 isoform X2 [Aegilops tauschii subsp. strangulata]